MGRESLRGHIDSFPIHYADGQEFGSASAAIVDHDDMCRLRATVNRGVMSVCTSNCGRSTGAKDQAGLDARRAKKIVSSFLQQFLPVKRPAPSMIYAGPDACASILRPHRFFKVSDSLHVDRIVDDKRPAEFYPLPAYKLVA
jgi:hypothetical protein